MPFEPAYIQTGRAAFQKKRRAAHAMLKSCTLCPRHCRVDRTAGKTGICQTGNQAWVAGVDAHFGEEAPLVGTKGSGTIFFTHCSLTCRFCQNWDISHQGLGQPVSEKTLAAMMLELQRAGCHNINLVTPTHVVPQILSAVATAADQGLRLPLVYNTSGYECAATLQLLDGVVDIYMPDFKFWDPQVARMACHAPDYPEIARNALVEMHRQVGDLGTDENGIALRGVIVRHLVLPLGMAGTSEVMAFIAKTLSLQTYVNVMDQYRPCGQAHEIPGLGRRITGQEYEAALRATREAGLHRLDRPRRVLLCD
jgi:putative pyruvate formate lyase activating enzyme